MSKHPEKAVNLKTADLSLLEILKQANIVPGKIGVFEDINELDLSGYFDLQGIILILIEKGSCSLEVNMATHELNKGGIFAAFPGQIIHILQLSKDFKPLCIACSIDMVNDLTSQVKDSLQLIQLIKQSPYQQKENEEFEHLKKSFRFLQEKIEITQNNQHRYQIIKNLVLSIAFECFDFLIKKSIIHQGSNRKKSLFNAFLRNVEEKHRKEHSVKYYADELFVTSKYLSTVVNEISDKTPKQWIDEYIALDAKVLLQSSEKDIQEICEELNFPDVSFFGKFFKRMTGMSPKAFREKKD
jgi:AraC-like DNA-binding protein